MRKHYYPFRIKWGDCDAAAITFYPNYFAWFDAATWAMLAKAGLHARELMIEKGVFIPLVDVRAQFRRPGHLGDELVMESWIAEWRDKFFLVQHVARCGENVVLEGYELRCWAVRHPDDPRRFRPQAVPAEVRTALEQAGEEE